MIAIIRNWRERHLPPHHLLLLLLPLPLILASLAGSCLPDKGNKDEIAAPAAITPKARATQEVPVNAHKAPTTTTKITSANRFAVKDPGNRPIAAAAITTNTLITLPRIIQLGPTMAASIKMWAPPRGDTPPIMSIALLDLLSRTTVIILLVALVVTSEETVII